MKSFLRNLSKHLILWLILVFILQLLVNAEVYADKFEDVPGWPGIDDIRASAFSVYDATTDEFLGGVPEKLRKNDREPVFRTVSTGRLRKLETGLRLQSRIRKKGIRAGKLSRPFE